MAAPIRLRPPAIGQAGYVRGRPHEWTRKGGVLLMPSARSRRGFDLHWDDIVQVNPVLEQPKLIFYSLAQPIIRWGHRRFVRAATDGGLHGMRAGPRFLGRWAYVGIQMAQFRDRGKTAGAQGRPFTYRVGPSQVTPGPQRTVDLGTIDYSSVGLLPSGGPDPTRPQGLRGIAYNLLGQVTPNVPGYPVVPGPVVIRGGSRAPSMGR